MGTTATTFNMDDAVASLQSAFQKVFGVALSHIETSAYEGPTFAPGRNDWVSCGSFIGPSGPTQLYQGTQTLMIEAKGGAGGTGTADWESYAWTVMRALASQTQGAWKDVNVTVPYTELKQAA